MYTFSFLQQNNKMIMLYCIVLFFQSVMNTSTQLETKRGIVTPKQQEYKE